MKRKILDIQRLKIGGSSKAEGKALREHLVPGMDSPPPTPKSVRPPLDPLAESQLRSACAYVLENYKPSHILYDEQRDRKLLLDHAAVKESAPKAMLAGPLPSSKLVAPKVKPASAQTAAVGASQTHRLHSDQDLAKADDAVADRCKNEKARRRPLVSVHNPAITRADEPISGPALLRAEISRIQTALPAYSRSVSYPLPLLIPPKGEAIERPQTAPRTDSVDTSRSTPETDVTDGPWSDKASTAMTSADMTPALSSSNRASSQATHPGLEGSNSVPKVEAISAEWMRQKLEKHKQFIRQQRQAKKSDVVGPIAVTSPEALSRNVTMAPKTIKVQSSAVKALPTSKITGQPEQDLHPPRADSVQSNEQYTSTYTLAHDSNTTRAVEDSPGAQHVTRPTSRARSIAQDVKQYFRPSTAHRNRGGAEGSRPVSRARSIKRQPKDSLQPVIAFDGARPASNEGDLAISRSRSTDSFHTTVSEMPPSDPSSPGLAQSWRSWRCNEHSLDVPDTSRPHSSSSNANHRGRATMRDAHPSPLPLQLKPGLVNLNRELPPLPSLDKWKPVAPSLAQRSGQLAGDPITLVDKGSSRDDAAANCMDSSSSPPWWFPKPVLDVSRLSAPRLPEMPTAPPPPPPRSVEVGNGVELFDLAPGHDVDDDDDLDLDQRESMAPDATPARSATMNGHVRQRSSTNPTFLSDLGHHLLPSDHHLAVQKPLTPARARMIDSLPRSGSLRKTATVRQVRSNTSGPEAQAGKEAVVASTSSLARSRSHTGHIAYVSRQPPMPNFSIPHDQEAYARMHDTRFANVVEISAGRNPPPPSSQTSAAVDGKGGAEGKEKWWSRRKRAETWMDRVVQSGSKRGMILTDDVAGGPIVRF